MFSSLSSLSPNPGGHRRSPSSEAAADRPSTPTGRTTSTSSGGSSTGPVSPPSLPSLLSLHQLGIAPMSPLRRQLASQSSASQRNSGFWGAGSRSVSRLDDHHVGDQGGNVWRSIEGADEEDDDDGDDDNGSIDDDDDDESVDDVTQDSKDVLVERLTDLLQRLTQPSSDDARGTKRRSLAGSRHHDAAEISALHAKVDEMERVLASRSGSASSYAAAAGNKGRRRRKRSSVGPEPGDAFWRSAAPDASPPWLRSRFASEASAVSTAGASSGARPTQVASRAVVVEEEGSRDVRRNDDDDDDDETTDREREYIAADELPTAGTVDALGLAAAASSAEEEVLPSPATEVRELVRDAESLCAELSSLVTSLNARREESDHIHHLLIERAELAAQRIIELEDRVCELEDEAKDCDAEIKVLRIQLRAIEISSMSYVPPDADPELHRSIENWKRDWADLRSRRDTLRRSRVMSSASPEAPALSRR